MQQVSAIVNGKSSHVTVYQGRKRTRCKRCIGIHSRYIQRNHLWIGVRRQRAFRLSGNGKDVSSRISLVVGLYFKVNLTIPMQQIIHQKRTCKGADLLPVYFPRLRNGIIYFHIFQVLVFRKSPAKCDTSGARGSFYICDI